MPTPRQECDGNRTEPDIAPLVGICIPVHNHRDYITECIYSVTRQDYENKIVCLVDDASTDGSYEYMESLFTSRNTEGVPENIVAGTIGELPACLLRNEGKSGPSATRNVGLNILMQSCPIVGFLDSDDAYLPGKISQSVELLKDKSVGLVYSDGLTYYEQEGVCLHEYRQAYVREKLERENIMTTPIVSSEALRQVGLFDEDLRTCEDWDMWLRITEQFLAVHIPNPLYVIRVQEKSATFTVDQEKWVRDRTTVIMNMRARKSDK